MTFAGLETGEERANVIAYLNAQGSNLPLPKAAPAAAATDEAAKPAEGAGDAPKP
jgi:cytochrome c